MIISLTGVLRRTVVGDSGFDNLCGSHLQPDWTLKMASAQFVEASVANSSSSQDSSCPDDHFQ